MMYPTERLESDDLLCSMCSYTIALHCSLRTILPVDVRSIVIDLYNACSMTCEMNLLQGSYRDCQATKESI